MKEESWKEMDSKDDKKRYNRVHAWLRRKHNHEKIGHSCDHCKTLDYSRLEFALIKGRSHSKIRGNYMLLCPPCHFVYDETPERGRKISKARKGKPLSETHRLAIIKGLANSTKKHVSIISISDSGKIKKYPAVKEAVKKTGLLQGSISNCLTGRTRADGGLKWQYA